MAPGTVGAMEVERVRAELLRSAADGLRTALRRMEDDDVPAALRQVAGSSARRLPPPLLARALQELDRSPWLREETLATGEVPTDSAAHLFVARPDGWEAALERLVTDQAGRRAGRRVEELEEELAAAQERIDTLEGRLETTSDAVAAAERKARRRLMDRIESSERARRRAEQQAKDEAADRAAATARAERVQAELDATAVRMEGLRQMLERERRAGGASGDPRPSRGWFPDDPAGMAAELDRIVTAIRRPPAPAVPDTERDAAAVADGFPEGIRPDRPEAISWLMRAPRTWLIDGYNVAFLLDADPGTGVRSRIVAAAGRLVSTAAGGTMGVVVFDSSHDVSSISTDRRVRVVFAHSADEWILDHAIAGSAVVSSDRRVREGAEEAGAFGVWSEALAEWMASGRA